MNDEPLRNVEVFNHRDEGGDVIAGFWQYGRTTFATLHNYLDELISTSSPWCLHPAEDDVTCSPGSLPLSPDDSIVPVGKYVVLAQDGSTLGLFLDATHPRARAPINSQTPAPGDHYCVRARERDGKCLITGQRPRATWAVIKCAHIFPRAHDEVWKTRGYASLITDPAPLSTIGGPLRIDSIQNVLCLRSDIRSLWDAYIIGVNPDDDYKVTAFVEGYSYVDGLRLDLNHITDPRIRPLDELLRDHFLQGVLSHVKGAAGSHTWDHEEIFGEGGFDLSNNGLWSAGQGKLMLEVALKERIYDRLLEEGSPTTPPPEVDQKNSETPLPKTLTTPPPRILNQQRHTAEPNTHN